MFRSKTLVILSLAALLGVAACSDITSPSPMCPITGGPGTCQGG